LKKKKTAEVIKGESSAVSRISIEHSSHPLERLLCSTWI